MTTKLAGGKITGLLALTMEATTALAVGDAVHVNGDWTVTQADGSKPVLGHCSVANVKRSGSSYPVAATPGDCTIEARGFSVRKIQAGTGGITAGAPIKPDATGKKFIIAAVTDIGYCGIALAAATANNYTDALIS